MEMNCGRRQGKLLTFRKLRFERRNTFLEYVMGGCHIELSIAIDFTGSKGDLSSPSSLHYFDM